MCNEITKFVVYCVLLRTATECKLVLRQKRMEYLSQTTILQRNKKKTIFLNVNNSFRFKLPQLATVI